MAVHWIGGNRIAPDAPLSVISVNGGDGTAQHIIAGNTIDVDHPLAVFDVNGGGGFSGAYADLTGKPDLTVYELLANKAQANGYAGLDAGALVPVAQLGTGVSVTTKYLRGDQTWQTLPAQDFAYASLTGAPDLTIYPLLDGTRPYTGNLRAPTISIGGAPLTGPLLSLPVAATASANYGEISLGAGPFDGSTSGFFAGNSNGTHIAINAGSGYLGRMIDAQVAGVRMFGVGRGSQASGASATLNAIDLPSFTVTVTGSTNITTAAGFNYTRLGAPVYSAGSALTITNAATLAIEGAPSGAGAGPATITNTYALWVQAGATRLDGRVTNTVNGAASAPGLLLSGTPFAGTGTTSFPQLYVNDSTATPSTTLSTAGTYLGVNGHGTADLVNLMKDGVNRFVVTSTGVVAAIGASTGGPGFQVFLSTDASQRITMALSTATNDPYIGMGPGTGVKDLFITRDAANTLAQRNGTTAQVLRIYNTYTDASNNEYLQAAWSGNEMYLGTANNGTGVVRNLHVRSASSLMLEASAGGVAWILDTAGAFKAGSNLNIWNGTSALATNATAGFLGHPSSAGAPTGIPASVPTGQVPCEVDTINGRVYFYYGAAWHYAALT